MTGNLQAAGSVTPASQGHGGLVVVEGWILTSIFCKKHGGRDEGCEVEAFMSVKSQMCLQRNLSPAQPEREVKQTALGSEYLTRNHPKFYLERLGCLRRSPVPLGGGFHVTWHHLCLSHHLRVPMDQRPQNHRASPTGRDPQGPSSSRHFSSFSLGPSWPGGGWCL